MCRLGWGRERGRGRGRGARAEAEATGGTKQQQSAQARLECLISDRRQHSRHPVRLDLDFARLVGGVVVGLTRLTLVEERERLLELGNLEQAKQKISQHGSHIEQSARRARVERASDCALTCSSDCLAARWGAAEHASQDSVSDSVCAELETPTTCLLAYELVHCASVDFG